MVKSTLPLKNDSVFVSTAVVSANAHTLAFLYQTWVAAAGYLPGLEMVILSAIAKFSEEKLLKPVSLAQAVSE